MDLSRQDDFSRSKVKYPRTYHLPWSDGATSDDKTLKNVDCFIGKDVVVTLKMDGENTTMYRDALHARSLDYAAHPSRSRMRAFHAQIAHLIGEGLRICGENMQAKHSIWYQNLKAFFYGFAVFESVNAGSEPTGLSVPGAEEVSFSADWVWSWADTCSLFKELGIEPVPVLYEGPFNAKIIKGLVKQDHDGDPMEGYVVRNRNRFRNEDFANNVAKYVRANHVQTDEHWLHTSYVPNRLAVISHHVHSLLAQELADMI